MEPSYFGKFIQFVKESLTEKFALFMPGCIMGFFGGKHIFFSGMADGLVTFGGYCVKYVGTVFLAFSSGLATAFGAYLIDKLKNKQNVAPQKRRKGKTDRAA
jgi:hypothetical protein